MPESMSDRMSGYMPERMSDGISEYMLERMSDRTALPLYVYAIYTSSVMSGTMAE